MTAESIAIIGELDRRLAAISQPQDSAQLARDFRALALVAGMDRRKANLALLGYAKSARRTGELLLPENLPRSRGKRSHGEIFCPEYGQTLAECALDQATAGRWQRLAKITEELWQQWCVEVEAEERDAALAGLLSMATAANGIHTTEVIPPPTGKFSCITADPPWQYDNRATRGAATNHYPTLNIAQLCGREPLPSGLNMVDDIVLPQVAENAHLYLWTTSAFLREAFEVVEAWGFTYKTSLVWVKPQMGIGNYFRSQHELVLFGIHGNLPVRDGNQASWFEAKRGRHSAKPERFYQLVEVVSPGPYLELFGRLDMFGPRNGWTAWGNEC